jgi:hypothetical protein
VIQCSVPTPGTLVHSIDVWLMTVQLVAVSSVPVGPYVAEVNTTDAGPNDEPVSVTVSPPSVEPRELMPVTTGGA